MTTSHLSGHRRATRKHAASTALNALAGLNAAVIGGTAGLGLALVRELRAHDAQVAFVARTRSEVERIAQQRAAIGIVGDISNKEDIYPIALQIIAALGGLDILINNASTLGPGKLELLADTECEDVEHALATNVLGPFRLTKALLGSLAKSARENGIAVVLNISSDAAVTPYPRWGAYGASKAALHHMTRIWAEELKAQRIAFLSLDPGDMDTALHRIAVPDADVSSLKQPAVGAREIVQVIANTVMESHNTRASSTEAVPS